MSLFLWRSRRAATLALGLAVLAGLGGCHREVEGLPGTVEYDHITVPATASEPLREVLVHEGQVVAAGTLLLRLDSVRSEARRLAAVSEANRARETLHLLEAGSRREARAEALANLQAAKAVARNAAQQFERIKTLVGRGVLPAAQLDTAEAERRSAEAQVAAAQAAGELLGNGNRAEEIAGARAAVQAAEARVAELAVDRERLEVRAPRAGRVDSLPYKAGDQPPVGAPLAVLLVGDQPYARVYVPAPQLAGLPVGATLEVQVQGRSDWLPGVVRAVRNEPTFTPYYALAGDDAARLSYLAEVQLGAAAAGLPAGLPLRARAVAARH